MVNLATLVGVEASDSNGIYLSLGVYQLSEGHLPSRPTRSLAVVPKGSRGYWVGCGTYGRKISSKTSRSAHLGPTRVGSRVTFVGSSQQVALSNDFYECGEGRSPCSSHRASDYRGYYNCREFGHWSRECPRWELNSKAVSASSTPKIRWSDLIVLVGSLSNSLKLVPYMNYVERGDPFYAYVGWPEDKALVVDQLGGVPLIGSSGRVNPHDFA
ncbi:hypothetical protein KY289_035780 [Solanum tuberosum]|nr:hypothetical protein KY289_035780 [Solanum tuberosum]